jgi:hypothetical protein
MYLQQSGNGEVDPSLLEAFQAQNAPKHAEFLETTHRNNCIEILEKAVSPEARVLGIYGQIHLTEVALFSEPTLARVHRTRSLAVNRSFLSKNRGEEIRRAVEETIAADSKALVARLQAIEWLREILPEEYRPLFDVEAFEAVGDVEAQIEALTVPEDQRRHVGALAIAS